MATFPKADKLEHLVAYMSLTLWFSNIYSGGKRRIGLGMLFFAMGVLLEFLQGLTRYRSLEINDMVANGLGIILGWGLAQSFLGRSLVKLDGVLERVRWRKVKS